MANFLLAGPWEGRTSYAMVLRGYALALRDLGHEVRLVYATVADEGFYVDQDVLACRKLACSTDKSPKEWEAWADHRLAVSVPANAESLGALGFNLDRWNLRTVWETDTLPQGWVKPMEAYGRILTGTPFNQQQFETQLTLKHPVGIAEEGYDPRVYGLMGRGKNAWRKQLDEEGIRHNFLAIAEWTPRKNLTLLVEAFKEAFHGRHDVLLTLKTHSLDMHNHFFQSAMRMMKGSMETGGGPRLQTITHPLPPKEMRHLYQEADAFVLPTRGEGWCRPALESMACGTPPILTGWSAHTHFVNNRNGRLLDYHLEHVQDPFSVYASHMRWAEASKEDLVAALHAPGDSHPLWEQKSQRARRDARHYTIKEVTKRMVKSLEEVTL